MREPLTHTEIDFTGRDASDLRAVERRAQVLLRWHALIGDGFGEAWGEPYVDLLSVLGALETDRLASGLDLARRLAGLIAFGLQFRPAFDPAELGLEDALQLLLEIPSQLLDEGIAGRAVDGTGEPACDTAEETANLLAVPVERDDPLRDFANNAEVAPQDAGKLHLVDSDLTEFGATVAGHRSISHSCLDEITRAIRAADIADRTLEIERRLVARGGLLSDLLTCAGIDRSTWSRWRSGLTQPRLDTWLAVEASLGKLGLWSVVAPTPHPHTQGASL